MVLLVVLGILAIVGILIFVNSKSSKKDNVVETLSASPEPAQKGGSDEELITNASRLAALGEALQQAKAHGDAKTVQEILSMTYTGPLPEKKEDGTYTQIY